jgi:predicted metal-dependent phosphoesterase TrpH
MSRVDLHTHSAASPDGSLTLGDYQQALDRGLLDYVAVTDHDRIDFALQAQQALGAQVIVGEEITTADGELVGLFLQKVVQPGMTARQTAEAIRAQGGLVYVPHPFEKVRKGLQLAVLDGIAELVDIVEVHNGRAFGRTAGRKAQAWAARHNAAIAASSDAHGWHGWGKTFSMVEDVPAADRLVALLRRPLHRTGLRRVGLRGRLYPKINRLRKKRS